MKDNNFKVALPVIILVAIFSFVGIASAHVVVKPSSVGIGAFQTFAIAVPAEKPIATKAIKLILPDGLNFVTPNVKPGWKVEVKTQATGKKITNDDGMLVDEIKPVEIDWTGGSIPSGERDEFMFSAQAPAQPSDLAWKAYQTYADGSVVAWDETPSNDAKNPYSITHVVNDLSDMKMSWWETNQMAITLGISLLALIISIASMIKNKTV